MYDCLMRQSCPGATDACYYWHMLRLWGYKCCADAEDFPKSSIYNMLMGPSKACSGVQVVASSDILFLAVKPWYIQKVVKDISSRLEDRHILVSIAAGVTLDQLQARLRMIG